VDTLGVPRLAGAHQRPPAVGQHLDHAMADVDDRAVAESGHGEAGADHRDPDRAGVDDEGRSTHPRGDLEGGLAAIEDHPDPAIAAVEVQRRERRQADRGVADAQLGLGGGGRDPGRHRRRGAARQLGAVTRPRGPGQGDRGGRSHRDGGRHRPAPASARAGRRHDHRGVEGGPELALEAGPGQIGQGLDRGRG
jgi:hypothetical protein